MKNILPQLKNIVSAGKTVADAVKIITAFAATGAVSVVVAQIIDAYDLLLPSPWWVRYSWPPLIIFCIALSILSVIYINRYRKMANKARSHAKIEDLWRDLSCETAEREGEVFDLLLSNISPNNATLAETRNLLNKRLRELLNRTVDIFTEYTGAQCAACIKCIKANRGSAHQWNVETLQRDSASFANRVNFEKTQKVEDNSGYMEIVVNRKSVYCRNDLKNDPNYINNRAGWQSHVNATFICPVPLVPMNANAVSRAEHPMALICVDNMSGSFDEESALRYLQELAWHVSIVWHLLAEVQAKLTPPRRKGSR